MWRAWLDRGDPRLARVLGLELVALWPAWVWYAERLLDGANEPWGLLALGTALALPGRRHERAELPAAPSLAAPTVLIALYAASYHFVPAVLSTLLAMAAVGVTYALWRHGTAWPSPRWGLVLLSVPMLTSFHFYLGYPLRIATGQAATVLLQLAGFNVARDGVCLRWAGRLVMIDTPCSGVRMLWAGMFLALALASRQRLGAWRAVRLAMAAVVIVLLGNTLRTTALFFPEAGIIEAPAGFHPAVGLAVFLGAAAAIGALCRFRPEPAA
jgi:exosortase/archaeosortase family protein